MLHAGAQMKVVGLTGGIASGKSTVRELFRGLGAPVLDADAFAREAVAPGSPTLEKVAQRFPGVVDAEGNLDRTALGTRVFSDPAERAALDGLVHPRVRALFRDAVSQLEAAGAKIVLYDVPLLFETGLEAEMDPVIVVTIPEAVQLERLRARNGLTEAEALARIRSQLPLSEKARRASHRIDNSGTRQETERQVREIWRALSSSL